MKEEEMEEEQKLAKTTSSRKRGYTTCHDVYAMEEGRRICVAWNDIGQPVGLSGRSLRSFLGTIARDPQKMPINFQDWRKVPKTCKDDVFAYVQRKYDISDGRKKWVFQDLNNKWRSWKYVNHKLYFKYNGKAKQQIRPNAPRLDLDQWKEAAQQWTSLEWKEKLKSLKSAQPPSDDCTPHHVAARNDTYTQVLGPDRPGRVSGVGTGYGPSMMLLGFDVMLTNITGLKNIDYMHEHC
ncbi:hypothetical protein Taro_010251 [Colocasia esculenta]|uniref:Uncharacterized protein n=1 Tax=Colocasia esculenta TaxID=4460 RepID=A0A843U7S7_COLES|nr:hypothetical protein [Colocasia esculenta]